MKTIYKSIIALIIVSLSPMSAWACTSMLVSAKASGVGRPLMWKHRDTGTEHNFVERVDAVSGKFGYVALFDGGDTHLSQAWMGMNDAGFAIMNTASYNLQPDTAKVKDREGFVMSAALQTCRTVNDFENLLRVLKKPLGVEANFGVMDANGGLAYFEVNDHAYKRYNVADTEQGYIIRTNFSVAGSKNGGYGYIRYQNVQDILADELANNKVTPEVLTEKASRSFWHSLMKHDFANDTCQWVIDQDFIPRYSSSASIVIEGVNPGQPVKDMIMWTVLGYPPCSYVMPVSLQVVPEALRPTEEGFRSRQCNAAVELKHKVFPINYGNGSHYMYWPLMKEVNSKNRQSSLSVYDMIRNPKPKEQNTSSK